MISPLLQRLTLSLAIVTSVAIGVIIGGVLAKETSAENAYDPPNNSANDFLGLYDTTMPGITTNVQEKWCVENNSTDPNFDITQIRTEINGFLENPGAWQAVGATKVDFVMQSSCSTANVIIAFYDPGNFPADFQCGGAACAPYGRGSPKVTVDEHPGHFTLTGMVIDIGFYLTVPDQREALIQHEMGHIMGLGHGGPVWGRVGAINNGGIYDGDHDPLPTANEFYQSRSHLNGVASPAARPCVGFPTSNTIVVSWFDTAVDDSSNIASVWRKPDASGDWVELAIGPEMAQGPVGPNPQIGEFAERAVFRSSPRSDVTAGSYWAARADIWGGPGTLKYVNWDPVVWSPQAVVGSHQRMCNLAVRNTALPGQIEISWIDASSNEDRFQIWYTTATAGGVVHDGEWVLAADCAANTESCVDFVTNEDVGPGEVLCVKGRSMAGAVEGILSNTFCTQVATDDWDFDGIKNEAESGWPLCRKGDIVNDDMKSYVVIDGVPTMQADDDVVNDGCPRVGNLSETGLQCSNTTDDDNEDFGYVNDGCPVAGAHSEASNIGTDERARCGAGFDAGPSGAWPIDLKSGGIPDSTDRINVLDLTSFTAPVRRLDTSPGHPNFDKRWDVVPGAGLFANWIVVNDLTLMLTVKPAMDPFYGEIAYNSGVSCYDSSP